MCKYGRNIPILNRKLFSATKSVIRFKKTPHHCLFSDEIFANITLVVLSNQTEFFVNEVVSAFLGKCFTVCPLRNATLADYFSLRLNPSWNYKVYVHSRGEEFFLAGDGSFGVDVASFILGKILIALKRDELHQPS